MATDGNDPFSKLPDHIIRHHIWKLIPPGQDIIRASAVSKSWLPIQRLFPNLWCTILHFLPDIYKPSPDREAKTQQFIKFVHQTLNSPEIISIKSFGLVTVKTTDDEVPGWICMALDKHVEDLAISVMNINIRTVDSPCLIPSRVLNADWIKRFSLAGIDFPLIENDSSVNLSSLTTLSLSRSTISDLQLRRLLHGCPILRILDLWKCNSLSEINISNNPNLEYLYFDGYSSNEVKVRVRAPKLKELYFFYFQQHLPQYHYLPFEQLNLEVQDSPNLKSLNIMNTEMNDDLFHKLLAQFPLLESLKVDCSDRLRRIRISNPLLKSIYIDNKEDKLEDVVIDCKNLSFFRFCQKELPTMPAKPSIRMDNPPYVCMAQFSAHNVETDPPYLQLKEFLTVRQPIFRHLSLSIFGKKSSIAVRLVKYSLFLFILVFIINLPSYCI